MDTLGEGIKPFDLLGVLGWKRRGSFAERPRLGPGRTNEDHDAENEGRHRNQSGNLFHGLTHDLGSLDNGMTKPSRKVTFSSTK